MNESDEPAPPTEPEGALAEFLSQCAEIEAIEFDLFCAARPAIANRLRQLYAEIGGSVRRGPATVPTELSVGERLAEPYDGYSGAVEPLGVDPSDPAATIGTLGEQSPHAPATSRYSVRQEIARGGMGAILEVWDRGVRRQLAMKVIASQRGRGDADERVVARFLEEAQITGQLEHPGIVPVHELGLDAAGRVFFTMPLLRGRELTKIFELARAEQDDWTIRKALAVLLKVCEAVGYAHAKDVIHRDLKPANVMVGHFGEAYVMDWGLARVMGRDDARDLRIRPNEEPPSHLVETDLQDLRASRSDSPLVTMDGAIVGTPAYMPPEQARGKVDELGARSDIYSIGAMLYHLLTGWMPYGDLGRRLSPRGVLAALVQGPPRPIREVDPDVPEALAAICEKAMARDPKDRYASCPDLARDLEAYLGHRLVAAHDASVLYALKLAIRRNRTAFAIGAAAAFLLLIAGAAFGWQKKEALAAERETEAQRRLGYDLLLAETLPERAGDVLAALPSRLPGMNAWLGDVGELLAREAVWRERPETGDRAIVLGACERLRELEERANERIATARDVADRLDAAWTDANVAIAASPLYGGRAFEPVESLLPLGPDPKTGLWEFWNPPSGDEPFWSVATGSDIPSVDDAIVVVLLPCDGDAPGVPDEPFFVGKYEVTQAQWGRVMGANPSLYGPGLEIPERVAFLEVERSITLLNPVESVSWDDCQAFVTRTGLALPSSGQWVHACRGGTTTDWSFGSDPFDAQRFANVLDQSNADAPMAGGGMPWNDRFPLHAPIGSFEPNAFGLFDMHGNVWEWTASRYAADWTGDRRRLILGGGYLTSADLASSTYTTHDLRTNNNQTRGLRVALAARVSSE